MVSNPRVSVVIPSYNGGRFVALAVDSALTQTCAPSEIIVVDDGSTDDTASRLGPYRNRIRYVYQPNGGLSKARNRGILESTGDLIAFLDADDRWLPEKLAKQVSRLAAEPTAALVHCDLFLLSDATGARTYVEQGRARFSGQCYLELFRGNHVIPSTVVLTRRAIERVGGFDEDIRRASTQDLDLWLRVARHYPVAYVPEPLVYYRLHETNASRNPRMILEDEFYVLEKTLREDPRLWQRLGRAVVDDRMATTAFLAGYLNVEAGDYPQARHYFRAAMRYQPFSVKSLAFWASTYLPPGLRDRLRGLKKKLAALCRRARTAT